MVVVDLISISQLADSPSVQPLVEGGREGGREGGVGGERRVGGREFSRK